MTFDQKVKSMTASEIVMAMVEALENPSMNIDMGTFGCSEGGICFGCAATNTICKISGVTFNAYTIENTETRAFAIDSDESFLSMFEDAINYLRMNCLRAYNRCAAKAGFAEIPEDYVYFYLPMLYSDFSKEFLNEYRKLAELIKS